MTTPQDVTDDPNSVATVVNCSAGTNAVTVTTLGQVSEVIDQHAEGNAQAAAQDAAAVAAGLEAQAAAQAQQAAAAASQAQAAGALVAQLRGFIDAGQVHPSIVILAKLAGIIPMDTP